MQFTQWLLGRLRIRPESGARIPSSVDAAEFEALVRAHGCWIGLLATILERERVIAGGELARALSAYAAHTATDLPEVGSILTVWATHLEETAVALRDEPSLH